MDNQIPDLGQETYDVKVTSVSLSQHRYHRTPEYDPVVREELRIQLLTQALFADGNTSVELHYEGSGDSGGVEICISPARMSPALARQAVQALLMGFVNYREGGWENNEGACGSITWDLKTDEIKVKHSQRFTDYKESDYEIPAGSLKTPSTEVSVETSTGPSLKEGV